MVNEKKEVQNLIKNFNEMLVKYADDPQYTYKFVNMLRLLLRLQRDDNPLPVAEIMTIIRYKKPEIFYSLKLRGQTDFTFDFLTGLEVDLEKAEETIKEYLEWRANIFNENKRLGQTR